PHERLPVLRQRRLPSAISVQPIVSFSQVCRGRNCSMDLTDSPPEAEFRAEVRAWLEGALPTLPWPQPVDLVERVPFWRAWQKLVHDAGYAGLSWPVEYGGQGADPVRRAVFAEELDRAGAPDPLNILGENLAGPTIIDFGSDHQKDRFLRPILRGDEIWCQ